MNPVPINPTKLETPCEPSTGPRVQNGYVIKTWNGKTTTAHRIAYCKANGLSLDEIAGMLVCHRCDNPPCCRPDHLFLGTHKTNCADMQSKGRGRYPGPRTPRGCKGIENNFALLTDEIVRAIREAHGSGVSIARRFNVSEANVSRIRNRLIWKHLA